MGKPSLFLWNMQPALVTDWLIRAPAFTAHEYKLHCCHLCNALEWGSVLKVRGGPAPLHFLRRGSAPPRQVNCSTAASIQQALEGILLPVVLCVGQFLLSNFSINDLIEINRLMWREQRRENRYCRTAACISPRHCT